jgi:hypothetical protein
VQSGIGFINWTVPSTPGAGYLVRASGTSGISDRSDAPFVVTRRLMPAITIVTPAGGSNLQAGTTAGLEWTAADVTGTMRAEYSVDGGTTWTEITSVSSTGDGPYTHNWIVPNEPTANAMIRVMSVVAGDTSGIFTISPATIKTLQVLSPNGGEIWRGGEQRTITWDAPEGITAVDIAYSTDGGAHWTVIQTGVPSVAGSMSYPWTVPALAQETNVALVGITNNANAAENDISDAVFTIRTATAGFAEGVTGPEGLHLLGNYPNPFSGRTELRWQQPRAGSAELRLYRQDGGLSRVIDLGGYEAGQHTAVISADGLAAGSYLYELRVDAMAARGVMVLTR